MVKNEINMVIFSFCLHLIRKEVNKMKNRANIIGVLRTMDDLKLKPNYSELSRALHVDRHTIKNTMNMDVYLNVRK